MKQHISAVALLVPGYDEAIAYYVERLGFELVEDTVLSATKRWVVVAPPGNSETGLLLAGLIRRSKGRQSATRRAAASFSS